MSWLLQTPEATSPKLITSIAQECQSASKGGAAFAFATATGVNLLLAEPVFREFLEASSFTAIIGLDAITDVNAIDALQNAQEAFPNFFPRLFLHATPGTLFHPKTVWFRLPDGGVTITGSGNLTASGLRQNWEALCVEKLGQAEIDTIEAIWSGWLAAHDSALVGLDDPQAIERAKANRTQRARIRKVLELPEAEGEVAEEIVDEIVQDEFPSSVLLAEVPKSGNRWNQVNFDVQTYQQYFGVTLGSPKTVQFHQVHNDGSLAAAEVRHAVAVKSRNYRFEVGAAHGMTYPANGNPIVVFEKLTDTTFKYVLLMPGEAGHALVQNLINTSSLSTGKKRRVVVTVNHLRAAWPGSPL